MQILNETAIFLKSHFMCFILKKSFYNDINHMDIEMKYEKNVSIHENCLKISFWSFFKPSFD